MPNGFAWLEEGGVPAIVRVIRSVTLHAAQGAMNFAG
jgi:hypothetical protein